MKKIFSVLILLLPITLHAQDATSILQKTKQAYGGEAWSRVNYLKMHHIGHQQWIEQSENPQGPFITSYTDTEEVRSVKGMKLYQKTESKMSQSPAPSTLTYVQNDTLGYMAFGERKIPLPYSYHQDNLNWLEYSPEHMLQRATDLKARLDKTLELEGVKHYQLSFIENKLERKIFINASTFLISEAQVETYSPYEFFFSLWGKYTTRIQYSLYALYAKGIVYPQQWDIYRTGQLWKRITINQLEFLETTDESVFTISEDVKKLPVDKRTVQDNKLRTDQVIEVAKGIFVIPGNWFTGWVEQEDGIVIMEAPISSGYSVQLLAEVKKRYPAKKVKGVIVTSDAWPHLAGVREYISAGIPVYTNKLNKGIIDRVTSVDHSPLPDNQQTKKAKPNYKLVDQAVTINDQACPLQIIPINGEGGERMVAVYFPNQKVLYASDLIQQQRNKSFFFIEYLSEVKAMVDRHKLDVETVYAMHTRPIAWKEVENALTQNKQ